MYPNTAQAFSSGYDLVELTVVPTRGTEAKMQRNHCEDLRYWSDGTEGPVEDAPLFLKQPQAPGHVPVEPADDVEFGHVRIPRCQLEHLEIDVVPSVEPFLIARPSHAKQLERFYV